MKHKKAVASFTRLSQYKKKCSFSVSRARSHLFLRVYQTTTRKTVWFDVSVGFSESLRTCRCTSSWYFPCQDAGEVVISKRNSARLCFSATTRYYTAVQQSARCMMTTRAAGNTAPPRAHATPTTPLEAGNSPIAFVRAKFPEHTSLT